MEKSHADLVIEAVGRRIAELRRDQGWTQQEAADRLGMEVQSLQRIERGTNLSIRRMVEIAACYGVPWPSLLAEPTTQDRKPGRPRKSD